MGWAYEIKALRTRRGLKQSALAEILGLDQATVSRWERGASEPTVAVKKKVLRQIEDFDPETAQLRILFERVVNSPFRVLLTAPGVFTSVAMSETAAEYLGMSDGRFSQYDWEMSEKTNHQRFVYEDLQHKHRLFADRAITHIDTSLALRLPNGDVVRNTSQYFPIWTGENSPRLLIRLCGLGEHTNDPGVLIVHRITDPPEVIIVDNEKAAPVGGGSDFNLNRFVA